MPSERLDVGSVGDDVARLHKALEARGFAVSPDEAKRRFFGPSTRDALRDCQTCHGLNATGEVDDLTTALLNETRPAAPAGAAFAREPAGPGPVPAKAAEPAAPIAGATVPPPPSEFERLSWTVTDGLGGTSISQLTDRERNDLAQEAAIDPAQLDALARAATVRDRIDRLSGAEGDQQAATVSAETEIVYGLLRAGAFANPDARSASDLAAAVKGAIESGVVSPAAKEAARSMMDRLNRVAMLLPSETSRASLGDALATLPRTEQLTEDQSVHFATLYTAFGGGAPLWTAVETSDLAAQLKPLKRTLVLQELTGSFAPMMRALQTRPGAAEDDTGAFLAAVRPSEWRTSPGPTVPRTEKRRWRMRIECRPRWSGGFLQRRCVRDSRRATSRSTACRPTASRHSSPAIPISTSTPLISTPS